MDVLKKATAFLGTKGIENPRLDAERLMGYVLGVSRIDLYLCFEQPLRQEERDVYKTLLRRRAAYEPLQYILGETEFMSLPFKVTPEVLIPRPETEILVERIVEEMKEQGKIRILDIGVGSGNIAISLAEYLTEANVVGVDATDEVLALAKENAERNKLKDRMRFIRADAREEGFCQAVDPPFDVVVSNPPYISLEEWETLPQEIREHEPKTALCDEVDGLSFFRLITRRGGELLESGGKIFFEVGDRQSGEVQTILRDAEYDNVTVFLDLNGIERVVTGRWGVRNSR